VSTSLLQWSAGYTANRHDVFSYDDDEDATVLFTMPAGAYTLENAYREDDALLDAIVISNVD